MFLAVDIGNTITKAAFFEGDIIKQTFRFEKAAFPDELIGSLADTNGCAVAGVVPNVTNEISNKLTSLSGKPPLTVSGESKLCITLDYETPHTLGIDRVCGVCGAISLYKIKERGNYPENDIIVTIDFGTATTVNIVQYPYTFTGGMIAPGLKTMFSSLTEKTAALPDVNVDNFENTIGKSTVKSIASGVVNATLGMIDRMISELNISAGNPKLYIYITGGNAEFMLPFIKFDYEYTPDLVLRGIKEIFELNSEK